MYEYQNIERMIKPKGKNLITLKVNEREAVIRAKLTASQSVWNKIKASRVVFEFVLNLNLY